MVKAILSIPLTIAYIRSIMNMHQMWEYDKDNDVLYKDNVIKFKPRSE